MCVSMFLITLKAVYNAEFILKPQEIIWETKDALTVSASLLDICIFCLKSGPENGVGSKKNHRPVKGWISFSSFHVTTTLFIPFGTVHRTPLNMQATLNTTQRIYCAFHMKHSRVQMFPFAYRFSWSAGSIQKTGVGSICMFKKSLCPLLETSWTIVFVIPIWLWPRRYFPSLWCQRWEESSLFFFFLGFSTKSLTLKDVGLSPSSDSGAHAANAREPISVPLIGHLKQEIIHCQ